MNPETNHGLKGWSVLGGAKIEIRVSSEGNSFIVAHSRSQKSDSFSQKVYMKKDVLYTFSGMYALQFIWYISFFILRTSSASMIKGEYA